MDGGRVRVHPSAVSPGSVHPVQPDAFAQAQGLPFRSTSFDTVLCAEVLEHVDDPRGAVRDMARVLRPGGALLLSAPFLYRLHELPHDYFRFTPAGLASLLDSAGLAPERCLARGRWAVVLADVCAKQLLRLTRRVGDRLRLAPRTVDRVVRTVVVGPQLAAIALAAPTVVEDLAHPGHELSLGYVVLARRPLSRA